jgi:pre-mRNA-splicing factor ISY1
VADATGKGAGYRYFGAAKKLPGVKELFEKEKPRQLRRTRHEMYRHIDADYYGFRDDEDGVLVGLEVHAEKKMRAEVTFASP